MRPKRTNCFVSFVLGGGTAQRNWSFIEHSFGMKPSESLRYNANPIHGSLKPIGVFF